MPTTKSLTMVSLSNNQIWLTLEAYKTIVMDNEVC